ncbi:MAG TPA: exo-beta-N-acetylmuramidase NamZ domain-containing protein [Gemmatimonadales bacterium]|nr:exo-beta-N-acetylmuramidase NamZ domain-containing protein [Gemmatimonadales bacterium]
MQRWLAGLSGWTMALAMVLPAGCAAQSVGSAPAPVSVRPGISVLLADSVHLVAGRSVGLVTNHTGIGPDGTSDVELLLDAGVALKALYSPEHGFRGAAAPGEHVDSSRDSATGLPIYSLYGSTAAPTDSMLAGIDVMLVDLQDVGARYYTYISTALEVMKSARRKGIPVLILDRPNPIGGRMLGNVLDTAFATFVGKLPVPMRHGLTMGELARFGNAELGIGAELHVIPTVGWDRTQYLDETALPFVPPSPNLKSVESLIHYPGTCLFEGTNLSVGRGSEAPFEQIGAPWLDSDDVLKRLDRSARAGVTFEPVSFTPSAPGDGKFAGVRVEGIRLHVTDRAAYDATRTAVALIAAISASAPDHFEFLERHFDRLAGTDQLRLGLEAGRSVEQLVGGWPKQQDDFARRIAPFLIYPAPGPAAAAELSARVVGREDSALIGQILLAEDRRDPTDPAIAQGLAHADALVRRMAQRAAGRIADPSFAAREELGPLPAPTAWPEPAWRLRYRELAGRRTDCAALRHATEDAAWQVRLRAADVADTSCARDAGLVAILQRWVDHMPGDATSRAANGVSWHAGAHAIVALARLRPDIAERRVSRLARHDQWQVRMYAARAAAILPDLATLRMLARDRNDNVKEAALLALPGLTGHVDDPIYRSALHGSGAQAVRAAALALGGTPSVEAREAASATFERWVARGSASERDVRLALLEAAGRPVSDDRPPAVKAELPERAVALALGEDVRLRVVMSPASGGGEFVVRLRGDAAPVMAARILELANAGYYDGLTWHRVEADFVIQGGSQGDSEYVGLPAYLRDELGNVPHLRGTIGMSTRGHDTGDGQWFVNLRDNLRLNRDYTVFAEVVEGMDVVDGVLEGDVIASIQEVAPTPE